MAALGAQIEAQRARADLAELDFYPDFTVSAGYEGLGDREDQRFSVGIGVTLPLYLDKRRTALDEAHAARLQAEWDRTSKAAEIAAEVQRAYDRVDESRHVLALYRERLLPKAEENLEAARADYQSGAGDFLTLVTAEKNLRETQLTATEVLADYHRRLARLESSVGGTEPLGPRPKLRAEAVHE